MLNEVKLATHVRNNNNKKTKNLYLERSKAITGSQHEFVKNLSCQTNLTAFSDKVTKIVYQQNATDLVYLDFNKAFGNVEHNLTL